MNKEGRLMRKKVLFICTHNSARSQMAEGLFRILSGNCYKVYSAGIQPSKVNPYAIKVMAEIDVDISFHRSKSVEEFRGMKFDYVITVCDNAKQPCPIFLGKHKKIHWRLEDPVQAQEEEKFKVFRKVRDQIEENILNFLSSSNMRQI